MKFEMSSCGGCRTCELACSFHHTGEFAPTASSLKVLEKTEGPGYLILLREETEGDAYACDGCKGLDVPLCMEYCREIDDLYKIVEEFKEKTSKQKTPSSKRRRRTQHARK